MSGADGSGGGGGGGSSPFADVVDPALPLLRVPDPVRAGGAVAATPPSVPAPEPPLHVRGGASGVVVHVEALRAAAARLDRVADELADAVQQVRAAWSPSPSGALDPAGAVRVLTAFDRVTTGPASLPAVSAQLSASAASMRTTGEAYEVVEQASASRVQVAAAALVAAVPLLGPVWEVESRAWRHELERASPGLLRLAARQLDGVGGGGPSVPAQGQPAAALLAVSLLGPDHLGRTDDAGAVRDLSRDLTRTLDRQGLLGGRRAVVTTAPADPSATPTTAPRGLGDVMRRLDAIGPGASPAAVAGRVLVQRVTFPGRPPVVEVFIPGTQVWTAGGSNPFDAASDLLGEAGERTAAMSAVEAALEAAGVTAGEPLLLAGHSQGGITAAALAADPAFRARYDVRAVVTAGSPTAAERVPAGIAVVALEHGRDLVPGLDGAPERPTPDTTTVTSATPLVHGARVGPHDTLGYAATGDQVDASRDPALVAARARLAPFLAAPGEGAVVTSTLVQAHRVLDPVVVTEGPAPAVTPAPAHRPPITWPDAPR